MWEISGKVKSNTYRDGNGIESREVRHQTDKLEISGVYRYSVEIQKQGSSVSCRGVLIVYSKLITYMKILNNHF